MKLRNMFLAIAVAAVAGINVYKANDVMDQQNNLSLLTVENIAEAGDAFPIVECGTSSSVEAWWSNGYLCAELKSDSYTLTGYCDGSSHECTVCWRGITFNGGQNGIFTC